MSNCELRTNRANPATKIDALSFACDRSTRAHGHPTPDYFLPMRSECAIPPGLPSLGSQKPPPRRASRPSTCVHDPPKYRKLSQNLSPPTLKIPENLDLPSNFPKISKLSKILKFPKPSEIPDPPSLSPNQSIIFMEFWPLIPVAASAAPARRAVPSGGRLPTAPLAPKVPLLLPPSFPPSVSRANPLFIDPHLTDPPLNDTGGGGGGWRGPKCSDELLDL